MVTIITMAPRTRPITPCRRNYWYERCAGSGADGNGDGSITQADYTIWKTNYAFMPVAQVRQCRNLALLCCCYSDWSRFQVWPAGVASSFPLKVEHLDRPTTYEVCTPVDSQPSRVLFAVRRLCCRFMQQAANQTADITPIQLNSNCPTRFRCRAVRFWARPTCRRCIRITRRRSTASGSYLPAAPMACTASSKSAPITFRLNFKIRKCGSSTRCQTKLAPLVDRSLGQRHCGGITFADARQYAVFPKGRPPLRNRRIWQYFGNSKHHV